MEEIKFPKFCNAQLQIDYQHDGKFMLMPSDFRGAFAYWVAAQNPNKDVGVIGDALIEWSSYVDKLFTNPEIPQWFTYQQLNNSISEEIFGSMKDILALNEMKPDFIDLYALARNVFYLIIKQEVTENYKPIANELLQYVANEHLCSTKLIKDMKAIGIEYNKADKDER